MEENVPSQEEVIAIGGGDDDVFGATRIDNAVQYDTRGPPEPTEEEINTAIEEFSIKGRMPQKELHGYIFQTLNRRRVEAIMESDYDKAAQNDKIADVLRQYIKIESQKSHEKEKLDALYDRYVKITDQIQKIKTDTEARKRAITEESEQRRMEMEAKHQIQNDELSAKFKDPNFLTQFSKPSQKLVDLREHEKNLAIARQYDAAKLVKAEADRLAKEETADAEERIAAQQSLEREALLAKQQRELDGIRTHLEKSLDAADSEAAKSLWPLERALEQMRAKKDTVRLPRLNRTPRAESAGAVQPTAKMQSPRTQKMLAAFKAKRAVQLLPVRPVDERSVRTGTRRSRTRASQK